MQVVLPNIIIYVIIFERNILLSVLCFQTIRLQNKFKLITKVKAVI